MRSHGSNPTPPTYSDPHGRWGDDKKKMALESCRAYTKTPKGRAIFIRKSYAKVDDYKGRECDVTVKFIEESILKPCIYCGEINFMNMGLDRVDNSKGHTMSNCVPCCDECNVARSNHFTYLEMFEIGTVIKSIKEKRILCQQ